MSWRPPIDNDALTPQAEEFYKGLTPEHRAQIIQWFYDVCFTDVEFYQPPFGLHELPKYHDCECGHTPKEHSEYGCMHEYPHGANCKCNATQTDLSETMGE